MKNWEAFIKPHEYIHFFFIILLTKKQLEASEFDKAKRRNRFREVIRRTLSMFPFYLTLSRITWRGVEKECVTRIVFDEPSFRERAGNVVGLCLLGIW